MWRRLNVRFAQLSYLRVHSITYAPMALLWSLLTAASL